MEDKRQLDKLEYGEVNISNEVIGIIAGLAAKEVSGVVGMNSSIGVEISEIFGKKIYNKGVKIEIDNDNAITVNLNLVIDYGIVISEICSKIQQNVKKSIETMTEMEVLAININIQGIKQDVE
ncbi:MAG: Asp23/Gls24 family envelope stress response protein [Peptostreptococcaceae bacterium]|nr:Asp23/Gls24 family envelope stress response protein [Peptostreptococcaceae bacterium]